MGDAMEGELSFGIGCFHFGVKGSPPFTLKGSDYTAELRTALGSIPNIDNISIYSEPGFESSSIEVTEEPPHIDDGSGLFPYLQFFHVEFEVYLPYRVQERLARGTGPGRILVGLGERFRVTILYGYHFPATFVELLDTPEQAKPSNAVVVLRKFFGEELGDNRSDLICFERLGPSPFHAECYLSAAQDGGEPRGSWRFNLDSHERRGYNKLVFSFNPEAFAGLEEAREGLFEDLRHEVGFFYLIQCGEVWRGRVWAEIERLVGELIAMQRTGGAKGIVTRLVRSSGRFTEVLIRVAEFESWCLFGEGETRRAYAGLYSGGAETYLQPYVDNMIDGRMAYPTAETTQLLRLLERGRAKTVEIIAVLASALLGGAVGALLTGWLSG